MKYLYIPTTTLNFNNILSTGSISPAAVYVARKFGYNKFETIPANPFQNVLLLYCRYPVFSIMDADRDSFPLVIRIRADRLLDMNHDIQDISAYEKTIYLDPATTEFLFATPEAKQITMIKAEPSLTTKLVGIYQSRMQVVNFKQINSFIWSREMLDNIADGSRETACRNCEADIRINRLKGFVCGYMLGAYKSLDEKVAKFRSVMKEQRNEISAMLNKPSRGNQEKLRRALESCATLDELWSIEGVGRRRFEPEQGDRIINDRGQISALEYRHESDAQFSLLLMKLFNTYCLTNDFAGQLDESRFNVAIDGAKAIKNLMGSEWEGSPTQGYINDLLNNIKSGSSFDFNSSNNRVLKSFAAFVQKGDDIDKLETFLVDQGIGDFKYAFALWGAMFGFSKIPKTVYNLPEFPYRIKMHNYIHSVVHGIPLDELEETHKLPKQKYVSMETPVCEHSLELVEKFQKQFPGAGSLVLTLTRLLDDCGGVCKDFFEKLGKVKFSRKKDSPAKKDVVSFFKAHESQSKTPDQPSLLVVEQNTLNFWDDPLAFEIIGDTVPSDLQHHIKEDLKWFLDQWKDPFSRYYGWKSAEAKSSIRKKSLDMRTNTEAIEYYKKHLEKHDFRECSEVRSFFTADRIENFCRLLASKYL